MRPLVPALAVSVALAGAGSAFADEFDCSKDSGVRAFYSYMADLRREDFDSYDSLIRKRLKSDSDSRYCTVGQWCSPQGARLKLSKRSMGHIIVIQSYPKTPCSGSWAAVCEARDECRYETPALVAGKSGSGAEFKKTASGQVRVGIKTPWSTAGALGAATGGGSGWRGLAFSSKGETYRIQFRTRFLFRQDGSELKDTRATLPDDVMSDLCASNEILRKDCAEADKAGCAALGLLGVKGRKDRFKDARGGDWREKGGACSPSS